MSRPNPPQLPTPQTSAPTLPKLLTDREAAQVLGLSCQTLANDRATQRRIPYIKVLRRVRYQWSDLEAFIAEHRISGKEEAQ